MTEAALVLHGEITVPYALMQDHQAPDVERLLQGYGVLPVLAQERRWRQDPERYGYVLTFTLPLALIP